MSKQKNIGRTAKRIITEWFVIFHVKTRPMSCPHATIIYIYLSFISGYYRISGIKVIVINFCKSLLVVVSSFKLYFIIKASKFITISSRCVNLVPFETSLISLCLIYTEIILALWWWWLWGSPTCSPKNLVFLSVYWIEQTSQTNNFNILENFHIRISSTSV